MSMLERVNPTPAMDAVDGGYGVGETEAMQRSMLRLFEHWGVSDIDAAVILGGIAPRTVGRWRASDFGRVTHDLADRMSLLLGIHMALRVLFDDRSRGFCWIKAPNEAFGGRSALEVMRGGSMADLVRLRGYLDAMRG